MSGQAAEFFLGTIQLAGSDLDLTLKRFLLLGDKDLGFAAQGNVFDHEEQDAAAVGGESLRLDQ